MTRLHEHPSIHPSRSLYLLNPSHEKALISVPLSPLTAPSFSEPCVVCSYRNVALFSHDWRRATLLEGARWLSTVAAQKSMLVYPTCGMRERVFAGMGGKSWDGMGSEWDR
jgi:hypothetical protein